MKKHMRILYYTWFENSEKDMVQTFISFGYEVVKCNIPFEDYERDDAFEKELRRIVLDTQCEWIFSFDFFPLIARVAEALQKKYLAWIYDSPHYTLYSPAVRCSQNYIFVFDRKQYDRLKQLGIQNLYHLPLAANTRRLKEQLGDLKQEVNYHCDVSFVGSLYEQNLYDKILYLPEYLNGYLTGIMTTQQRIYGYNLIPELLTENIVQELNQYVDFGMRADYMISDRQLYSDMLNAKITSNERIHLLGKVAERFELELYTASKGELVSDAIVKKPIDYQNEMPEVFRTSKINLNITLRSIESGIPLRAVDIMGAGGFLMSNYQEELAENFEDGKEMVLYEGETDLLEKISYYLNHDEERKAIAYRGWEKVEKEYSYLVQARKMLKLAGIEDKSYERE